MKITQDVRDYAAQTEQGAADPAVEEGLRQKAAEFRAQGGDIYGAR
jgi:phosphomethylpyrimidine synthase